jgi:hypothetical protein
VTHEIRRCDEDDTIYHRHGVAASAVVVVGDVLHSDVSDDWGMHA